MRKPDVPWSWVDEPTKRRPQATGPGRYSRPPSIREMIIAGAFGREVRRLRIALGLSQRDLANIVGVSQANVAQLESSRIKNVTFHQVFDFADALKVDPGQLTAACADACARFERGLLRRSSRIAVAVDDQEASDAQ